MDSRLRRQGLAAVLACAGASALAAQVQPLGDEVQANATITADQAQPAVAGAGDGRFVVVWQSAGQDESGSAVVARRMTQNAVPSGEEIVANLATESDQDVARVAGASDGRFVVVWQHAASELDTDVRGRLFSAAGLPLSDELAVHAASADGQSEPVVGMVPGSGDFVVAWTHAAASDTDVRLRRFTASGAPRAAEVRANLTTAGLQLAPAIAVASDGQFVVAWQSLGQDGDGWGVYLRRFAADGRGLSGEVRVAETTVGDQLAPALGIAPDGRFVVAWNSFGQDGDRDGVFARLFSRDGTAASGEVAVNVTTAGRQSLAAAAFLDGGPLVVWRSSEGDGSGAGVFARSLAADGRALGGETRINQTTSGNQTQPAVARLAADRAAVVWASEGIDGDGLAVMARRARTSAIGGGCSADAETLCLLGGRYRVRARFRTAQGAEGQAKAVALTPDTGFFWFFTAANVELLVKVLDGCPVTSRHWVFAGGLTNVEVTLTVVDGQTGSSRTYVNPLGTAFAPLQDTTAFANCG
jgi:hypothetical protein